MKTLLLYDTVGKGQRSDTWFLSMNNILLTDLKTEQPKYQKIIPYIYIANINQVDLQCNGKAKVDNSDLHQ